MVNKDVQNFKIRHSLFIIHYSTFDIQFIIYYCF
jgi:hypothetical protein